MLVILVDVTGHALRGLTLREATRDAAWTEITAIWQILEPHLTRTRLLRVDYTCFTPPRINHGAALLLIGLRNRGPF